MRCEDIMRRPVQSVGPLDSVATAARRMRDTNIGFLPVCDEHGRVRGVITDRDIAVRGCAEARDPETTEVQSVMTNEVIACHPTDDLRSAISLMAGQKKSRVLCVDADGKPAGVLSLSDIARADTPDALDALRAVAAREVVSPSGATPPA